MTRRLNWDERVQLLREIGCLEPSPEPSRFLHNTFLQDCSTLSLTAALDSHMHTSPSKRSMLR